MSGRRRLLLRMGAAWCTGSAAAAITSAASAQASGGARIGVLTLAAMRAAGPFLDRFRAALRELGHVEGRHVNYEMLSADGRVDRLDGLAAQLVARKPDLLVAGGGNISTQALLKAGATMPVVMTAGFGVVEAGLAQSLARPGGSVTGVSVPPELGFKFFELIRDAVPGAARVAVLALDDAREGPRREEAKKFARALFQFEVEFFGIRGPADLPRALQSVRTMQPHALIVVPDPLTYQLRDEILRFARAARLPDVHGLVEDVEDGALLALHLSLTELLSIVARQCDRLLKGAKPGDLPFEQPTRMEVAINLKTARSLGLTIPQAVLRRAETVIE